jgi:hypothetical protein
VERVMEITFRLGELTCTLDDITNAFATVGVKADCIIVNNPEAPQGVMTFVYRNGDTAGRALDDAQIKHTRRQLLVLTIEKDEQEELKSVAQALTKGGITVNAAYHLSSGNVALGVDKFNEAESVVRNLGVLL